MGHLQWLFWQHQRVTFTNDFTHRPLSATNVTLLGGMPPTQTLRSGEKLRRPFFPEPLPIMDIIMALNMGCQTSGPRFGLQKPNISQYRLMISSGIIPKSTQYNGDHFMIHGSSISKNPGKTLVFYGILTCLFIRKRGTKETLSKFQANFNLVGRCWNAPYDPKWLWTMVI